MSESKQIQTKKKISAYFDEDERIRYSNFIEATGRKKGEYMRLLVMREVAAWENSSDQAAQLRNSMRRDGNAARS